MMKLPRPATEANVMAFSPVSTTWPDNILRKQHEMYDLCISTADLAAQVFQDHRWYGRGELPFLTQLYRRLAPGSPTSAMGIVMRHGKVDFTLAVIALQSQTSNVNVDSANQGWEVHRRMANKALLPPKIIQGFARDMNAHAKNLVDKILALVCCSASVQVRIYSKLEFRSPHLLPSTFAIP